MICNTTEHCNADFPVFLSRNASNLENLRNFLLIKTQMIKLSRESMLHIIIAHRYSYIMCYNSIQAEFQVLLPDLISFCTNYPTWGKSCKHGADQQTGWSPAFARSSYSSCSNDTFMMHFLFGHHLNTVSDWPGGRGGTGKKIPHLQISVNGNNRIFYFCTFNGRNTRDNE